MVEIVSVSLYKKDRIINSSVDLSMTISMLYRDNNYDKVIFNRKDGSRYELTKTVTGMSFSR